MMQLLPRAIATGALLAVLAVASAASADVIERRGAEPRLEGSIGASGIDAAGVSIVTEFGARHVVPWDRVRRVIITDGGDRRVRERAVARYAEQADQLWRARSRVERGDVALAAPLFERLFEMYRGTDSETALVVAEGLLRCRLAQGANASAVAPALEAARLRRAGVDTRSYGMLDPVWDADLELVPQLPPAWLTGAALQAALSDLENMQTDDAVIRAMALAYARAMRRHLGVPEADQVELAGDVERHSGVRLLGLLADALSPDASTRADASDRLGDLAKGLPPAFAVWSEFGRAVAGLRSEDASRRKAGVVSLLSVAVEDRARQPYLGGLSLAIAQAAAARDFDQDVADALANALAEQYPTHPVLRNRRPIRWPPLERGSDE